MVEVRFALPEYQRQMGQFYHSVIRDVAASSPIVGQIRERSTQHRGPSRNAPQPSPVDHEPSTFQQEVSFHFDIAREGRVEDFINLLISAGEEYVSQLEQSLVRVLHEVTEATGGVIDAQGEPLTFDHIIELIEKVELASDEDGGLSLPTILMNPETRKKLESKAPTPDQITRLNDVLRMKLEENQRNKRTRRLGR